MPPRRAARSPARATTPKAARDASPKAAARADDPTAVHATTVQSPTNIAVIKYWGKRDSKLNLPINSSVSVTIDMADLCTTTTVCASATFAADRLWLNGEEEDVGASKRVQAVLREVRARATVPWVGLKVHVVSKNNFPTAAGLASSAAGYSALAFALAKLHGVAEKYEGELSTISRMGSGSACRSLAGGFTAWDMGSRKDGTDSKARLVAPASHWPDLQVLILVVSDTKKTVSSTAGMQTSVETSPLLAHRAAEVVPGRLEEMETAYHARDFATFATLAMQDSNQFHSTCLDTHPPIFYLNDVSRSVINMVHAFNEACGEVRLGYTFDAGPNAVLLTTKAFMPQALAAVMHYFPPESAMAAGYVNKPALRDAALRASLPSGMTNWKGQPQTGAIKYVYATQVGPGAGVLPDSKSLADAAGFPKDLKKAAPAATGGANGALSLLVTVAAAAALAAAVMYV